MDVTQHGAKKKRAEGGRKAPARSRASKRSARQSGGKKKPSRASRKIVLPKTVVRLPSRKSNERKKFSRAASNMNMTELQFLAKSRGIPFGGLTKTKLIRKINNYY